MLDPVGKGGGLRRGFESYDNEILQIAQAPSVLRRFEDTLDRLEGEGPFFLFVHFSDPHEPYNAHGAVERSATLFLDGRELDTLETSEMTIWERELGLTAGRHVFELRSEDRFQVKFFEASRQGQELEVVWEGGALAAATKDLSLSLEVPATANYDVRLRINELPPNREVPERYRGEVAFVDRHVGEVLDRLEVRGLYESSIVVFTSDHGEALGERGLIGHVEHLHDELLNVPLVLKLPAGDPRAAELAAARDNLVAHIDVLPTLLEVAGLEPLPGQWAARSWRVARGRSWPRRTGRRPRRTRSACATNASR